jgi:hypothetical protein
MARNDVAPPACSAAMVGATSAALASARCCSAFVDSARIFAVGFSTSRVVASTVESDVDAEVAGSVPRSDWVAQRQLEGS